MTRLPFILALALTMGISACNQQGSESAAESDAPEADEQAVTNADGTVSEPFEIVPGLVARTLHNGYGRPARAGDFVEVHYTGWFQDETAEDGRGEKFDSSVDRGTRFNFPLGEGRVIQGWDKGVEGMLIGEKRELVIAPDLAYGERGYPGAIPPNSTLIFEVELFGAEGPAAEATE